ncbi:MAG: hypothetical protein ABIJ08_06725 [Nanoarchaeota archaeon]|uniref:Uncharacterized protein n=1 Tax=viral metagenome TaxID=1070528 RepID=A0A6M3KX58_9ZZZZ
MVTATNWAIHNSGDQKKVTADLTSVANNNTLVIPHLIKIEDGHCDCTTDDSISITWSGNTVTFLDGATLAGRLVLYGR